MAKKKKRYVGPTKEALTKGLAGPKEGIVSDAQGNNYSVDTGRRYTGPVSSPDPPPQGPKPLGIQAKRALGPEGKEQRSIEPLDIQLANETSAENMGVVPGLNPADSETPQTPQEARTRAIIIGYYKATHKFPSADKVMMLSQSPIQGTDPNVYARAWQGAESLPKELGASDYMQDTGYENLHGFGDVLATVREKQLGVEGYLPDAGPAPLETVKQHLRYVKGLKAKRNPDIGDVFDQADPRGELLKVSNALAQRLRRRGASVLWDTDAPEGDKDFIKAMTKYAGARQWAFSMWGSNTDQKNANDVIMFLKDLPITKSQQELLAENVGVKSSEWGDQNTLGTVIDAMRTTDDDLVHEIVFDAWMFGRPVGMSPSQARFEYASKFGIQRLPAPERQKYEESNRTLNGIIGSVTKEAGQVFKVMEEVPVIGTGFHALGWALNNTFAALNKPIELSMREMVSVIDVLGQTFSSTDLTWQETIDYMAKNEGEEPGGMGLHLSRFLDASNWARAWEEAEGKTPLAEVAKTISYDIAGKETPFAKSIGELADFSIMMFEGAMLDPVIRGGVKTAYTKGVFPAGRAAERYVLAARARYGAKGAARGEWVLRIDTSKMTPKDRQLVEGLREEYNAREWELANDAQRQEARGVEADIRETASSPDAAIDYASVKKYILSRGGLKHDAEARVAKGQTLGETRGASHGLIGSEYHRVSGKKKVDPKTGKETMTTKRGPKKDPQDQPVAVDLMVKELIADNPGLPFNDVNSFWKWMDDQRDGTSSQTGRGMSKTALEEEMAALDDIEARAAAVAAKYDEEGMAPEAQMFDNTEFIGEGQQAGLDIAVDQTATKTAPTATLRERGPEQMPGQTEMGGTRYPADYMGDWTSEMNSAYSDFMTASEKLANAKMADGSHPTPKTAKSVAIWQETVNGIGNEIADRFPFMDIRPGIGKSMGFERAARSAEATPTEAVGSATKAIPETAADGVKVKPVEVAGEQVAVDASIASDVQRLNDGGYPTTQSHSGVKADHPKGANARDVPAYVEFVFEDLDPVQKLRVRKKMDIKEAIKGTKSVIVKGKDADGRETIIVRGDVKGFTENLMTGRNLGEAPGSRLFSEAPVGSGGAAPPSPPEWMPPADWTPQGRTPLQNALFRTNAEVVATIDDSAVIGWLYDLPEGDLAIKGIAYKLGKTQNVDEVTRLLTELETKHGIEIDGGAAAVAKNMRQAAYRNGFGYRTPLRFFITSQTYGKSHSVDGSSDMTFSVAASVKLGKQKLTPADWARVREYRRRMWEADRPMEKQNILTEMWDEIKANMGEKEWAGFQKYKKHWYWASGHSILAGSRRAYLGTWKNGKPEETSRVGTKARARALAKSEVERGKAELANLTGDESPAVRARIDDAIADAEKRVNRVADACQVIDDLGYKPLEDLTGAEAAKLSKAQEVIDEHATSVPFKLGQSKKHLVHAENPRMLSWYMSGDAGRAFGVVDQAVLDPLMTIFKETVMASLGFPLRVNIGDEVVRLIPEGTVKRMLRGHVKAMKKDLKEEGLVGADLKEALHDRLAYDWVAQDMGDWVLATKGTHPRYFSYLAADLDSWRGEPIVQRLIEENKGAFPDNPEQVTDFIRRVVEEDSDVGRELRQFLADTYRYEGGTLDNPAFLEWTSLWEDRLKVIGSNETLKRSMTRKVTPDELKNLPDEVLWPVNAPADALKGRNISSPATWIHGANMVNPFHWIYQGVKVPKAGGMKVGTVELLGAISNKLRDTVFADKYYLERESALARNPHMDPAELHELCAGRAYRHTNRVTYSRSATVAEDMARNLLPFVNAYRQFWQYWGSAFLKHPISISVAKENYDMAFNGVLGTLSGGRIGGEGAFRAAGDYQAFLPSVPFWGLEKEEGDSHGVVGFAKNQLPSWSFLFTGPARTAAGALHIDPETLADVPTLSGMSSKRAPFSRQGRIFYGITGFNSWDDVPGGKFLFGDPERLDKAHANALIGQMAYGDGKTGTEAQRNKPWWWQGMDDFFHVVGMGRLDGRIKPEALFAEIAKTFLPTTVSYSPKEVRERGNWLYEYYDATRKGQLAKAAQMRAGNVWLDTDLSYYDATPEEQIAMKKDPANAGHLKFWVSPYNYSKDGMPYNGYEWQMQFTLGVVDRKDEDELISSIHNLYTDVNGGTYLPSAYRTGGTSYQGDRTLEEAQAAAKKKMTKALTWAKKISKEAAKQRGWDPEIMMARFTDPEKGWGVWGQICKLNGLDPVEYRIDLIAKVLSENPKMNAETLSADDALRALDMAEWLPNPKLAARMLTETPFRETVAGEKLNLKNEVAAKVVDMVGTNNWYWIDSTLLEAVGIKSSPKLDIMQMDLNKDYTHLKSLTVGSSEYKAARQAYYAKRERVFKTIPNGELLSGGTAERIMALPYAMDAQVTSMGTGKNAIALQVNYDSFIKVRDRELAKDDPNSLHIKEAWDRFVAGKDYAPAQAKELTRVAAWAYMLSEAKHLRREMMDHFSDYYEGKGESSSSKYGTARVDAMNKSVQRLRKWSPEFSKQLDDWFGTDANVGSRFLDWYTY